MNALMGDHLHIAEWRRYRGFTQDQLAEMVGVHRVTLARIEVGSSGPKGSTLRALAVALGVSVERLYAPPSVRERWGMADRA